MSVTFLSTSNSDERGNNFSISLGSIKPKHSVVVEFTYLVTMDLRKMVQTENVNDFLGQAEQSFYELLIPVCFKPKYAINPTGDGLFVSGDQASNINQVQSSIKVEIISSTELEIYDQSSSAENDDQLPLDIPADDGRFIYTLHPLPSSMGDVFLKIMSNSNLIPIENSDEREAAVFEADHAEARLFKFNDVLKTDNPLHNKYGLVVDYTIKRKMMHKVMFNVLISCL